MAEKANADLWSFVTTKLEQYSAQMINDTKALGIDCGQLERAQQHMMLRLLDKDYSEAETGAVKIIDGVKQLKREHLLENAWNLILSAEHEINEIKQLGADAKTAEQLLEAAKTEYNHENFEQSETYVKQALAEAAKSKGGQVNP
jgi:tagatose-1,6-bisphosphate aldolase